MRELKPALLLAILLLASNAAALSEYSHLFQPQPPDISYYYLTTEYCGNYVKPFNLPNGISARPEFAPAIDLAYKAKLELDSARTLAQIQRDYAAITPAAPLTLSYLSYECSMKGSTALSLAVRSVREAFGVADAKLAELEAARDAGYEGAATGVLEEAESIKAQVENPTNPKSLGARIQTTAVGVTHAWDKTIEGKGDFSKPVRDLIGEDSILREVITLDNKASDALILLEEEAADGRETFEREYKLAELSLEYSEKERLEDISPESLEMLDAGLRTATSSQSKSYREQLLEARQLLARAQATGDSAERTQKTKARGSTAKATALYRQAISNLSAARSIVLSIDASSKQLDSQLSTATLAAMANAEQAARRELSSKTYSAEAAKILLERVKATLANAEERPRGERIQSFARALKDIAAATALASEPDAPVLAARARLVELKDLVLRAKTDALSVAEEEVALAAANEALETGTAETATQILLRLDAIEESVLAKAATEYAEVVFEAEEAIPSSDAERNELEEIKTLFTMRGPLPESVGRLRQARARLTTITTNYLALARSLVEAHLQEKLETTITAEEAQVGEETLFHAVFSAENSLGPAQGVELYVGKLPGRIVDWQASTGTSIIAGRMTINTTAKGQLHWVTVTARGKAAQLGSSKTTVERADAQSAVVTRLFIITAFEDVTGTVTTNYSAETASADGATAYSYNGKELVMHVPLAKGENIVQATFLVRDPLHAKKSIISATDSSISYEYEVENSLDVEIPSATVTIDEPAACPNSKLTVKGQDLNKVTQFDSGGRHYAFVSFRLGQDEKKRIYYEAYCDPLGALAQARLSESSANATQKAMITGLLKEGKTLEALSELDAIASEPPELPVEALALEEEARQAIEAATNLNDEALATALEEMLDAATEGKTVAAKNARKAAEGSLKSLASVTKNDCDSKDYVLRRTCAQILADSANSVRLAQANLAQSIRLAVKAATALSQAQAEAAAQKSARKRALEDYMNIRESVLAEARAVEAAFVDAEEYAKSLPAATAARESAKKAVKLERELANLAREDGSGGIVADEYDADFVSGRAAAFTEAARELSLRSAALAEDAKQLVDAALGRAGSDSERAAAEKALQLAENGKWFTAMALASGVYGSGGGNGMDLALGGLGIAILITLAYGFWWHNRKPPAYKEVT
ncbi:hypothetical protein AUJ14_00580 [Candidatus Micrarchaeota archaeon CG1_02_55_22]|nr:MAG: hypothetical protein AUJ14_00580 [Candidatus Micrarchaeota archaeon CG1_02_55_22]